MHFEAFRATVDRLIQRSNQPSISSYYFDRKLRHAGPMTQR